MKPEERWDAYQVEKGMQRFLWSYKCGTSMNGICIRFSLELWHPERSPQKNLLLVYGGVDHFTLSTVKIQNRYSNISC
jgi:hypothetical protein